MRKIGSNVLAFQDIMFQGWDPGHRSCELINPGVHRDTCILLHCIQNQGGEPA